MAGREGPLKAPIPADQRCGCDAGFCCLWKLKSMIRGVNNLNWVRAGVRDAVKTAEASSAL